MPISPDDYKALCANWPSGVTIVTSRDGDRIQGMTVSAFTEVSLEPPLVLICADKATITHELIQASGAFSVSILEQRQEALSDKFASKKDEHRRFEGLECETGSTGCARIPGGVAWLDCTVQQTVEAGDHFVHIGLVESAEFTERAPLVYFRQGYRKIS